MSHAQIISFLIVGLLFGVAGNCNAQDAATYFDLANDHYRQGRFQEAIDAYELAIQEGVEAGELYFNMANCYYRLDEIGEAILYYEKAKALLEDDREVEHNLSIVNSKTRDSFSQLPEPFWKAGFSWLSKKVSPWTLFTIGAVFFLTALAIQTLRLWQRSSSEWLRRLFTWPLILGTSLIVVALAESHFQANHIRAVVVEEQADLVSAAEAEADLVITVNEGAIVTVLSRNDQMVRIQLSNGTQGWIPANTIAEI